MPQQQIRKEQIMKNYVTPISHRIKDIVLKEDRRKNEHTLKFVINTEYDYYGNIKDYLKEDGKVDEWRLLEDIASGSLEVVDFFKK